MKKFLLLLLFGLYFIGFANAQITIGLPNITLSQNNGNVIVPISVTNFNNIGAISLSISYDTNVLTYTGATSFPSHGTFIPPTSVNGVIKISWFDISPMNIGNGILMDLNFAYSHGNSGLNFVTPDCEIADTGAHDLNVTYVNGNISGPAPQNLTAALGGNVWFDANNNGIKDSDEKGVRWVTVNLYSCSGAWYKWLLTDSLGNYQFDSLNPGSYYVQFMLIDNNKAYKFTTQNSGTDSTINSHVYQVNDSSGRTDCVLLFGGEVYSTLNAGVVNKDAAAISGSINDIPLEYKLDQNFPNPFNPSTSIKYIVAKPGLVTIKIYNILGNEILKLVDRIKQAGTYFVEFNPDNYNLKLSSGVYIYQMTAGNLSFEKKMIFIK